MIDVATTRALMSKTHKVAYEIFEELASNNYQWFMERVMQRMANEVFELAYITTLVA